MVIKIWKYNYNSLNIYKLSNRSIYIFLTIHYFELTPIMKLVF